MSNDRLENILLIKIKGPVLRKIHKDFDNILVSLSVDLYFQKKNWRWNLRTASEENLGKNEESLFGPPIKRVLQEISSSDGSSSESDLSESDSDEPMFPFSLPYRRVSLGLQGVKNMNIGSNWVKHLNCHFCHFFMLGLLRCKIKDSFLTC